MGIELVEPNDLFVRENRVFVRMTDGPPIDLITIQAGKQRVERHVVIEEDDPYFTALCQQYGAGIVSVFDGLPEPDISEWPKGPSCSERRYYTALYSDRLTRISCSRRVARHYRLCYLTLPLGVVTGRSQ